MVVASSSLSFNLPVKCKTSFPILDVTQCFCCVTKIRFHIPHEFLGLKSSGGLHILKHNEEPGLTISFPLTRCGKVEQLSFLQETDVKSCCSVKMILQFSPFENLNALWESKISIYFYEYYSDVSVEEQQVLQDNLVHFLDFEVLKMILTALHKVSLDFLFSWRNASQSTFFFSFLS